jgi:hypothetical protein
MSTTIPTTEPASARAGDTWRWQRTLSDYPASTWTLSYTLFNAAGKVSIAATADGDDHLVSVAPATTAAYTAGRYDWVAHVSDGTDRHQVGAGSINVLPDLSAVSSYDGRSHARKMLDAIDALLEGRATTDQLDLIAAANVGSNSGDQSMQMRPEFLMNLRKHYAAMVASEDRASAIANGDNPGVMQMRWAGGR